MKYDRTAMGRAFYSFTMKAGRFLMKHPIFAQVLGVTWGLLGTLVGALVALAIIILPIKKKSGNFNGFPYLIFGNNWGGFNAVSILFIADNMGEGWTLHTKQHESGHAFQNSIFGPFTLFLVTIPSIIRYWVQRFAKNPKPYDSIWFEGSATDLGEEYHSLRLSKGNK